MTLTDGTNLTPMQAAKAKLVSLIANVHAAFCTRKEVAELGRSMDGVPGLCSHKITRPLPLGWCPISWQRASNCRIQVQRVDAYVRGEDQAAVGTFSRNGEMFFNIRAT